MKTFKIFSLLILIPFYNVMANFEFVGNIKSHFVKDAYIEFVCSNAHLRIYVIEENIVRFRYSQSEEFDEAPSYAVIHQPKKINYVFNELNDYFEIKTNELIIHVRKNPTRISIYDINMNLLNSDEESFGVSFDEDEIRCHKKLFNDELFYGLGEKTGNLLKNGNQYTLWNSDVPAYDNKDDAIYQSIPFFIGVRKHKAYGIFFDNTYKSYFNFGASNNRFYWFGADKGEMDYYFLNGPEIKKVISSYSMLTGKMELPPKWALGYQQSKWSYYPESTVRTLAKNFRQRDIPCDVIYLDIHYMDEYRVFTWDKNRFPNSSKMLSDLKNDGFKVITIVDPGVKADLKDYQPAIEGVQNNLFVKYPDGEFYQGEVWPSWAYFPDFTKEETRIWWGDKSSELIKQGISGIWNDMNEPAVWGQSFPDIVLFDDNGFKANHKKIHNVYALEMAKATFNGLKRNFNNLRPFILTRAGFAGIQKYAAVWTGDNVANQEHLKLACTMPIGMSLSGLTFIGSDVGGFFEEPSSNLYARWIQLGAFSPFFRGHTIINTKDQEPWAFGETIENISRETIKLRYRLIPYLYNEFYKSTVTGLPIIRAMFMEFQNDEECYKNETQYQYFFGENLLVAPVVEENSLFKKLYLPEGKWLELNSNKIYTGNKWIILEAPLNKIPYFLKEGGVLPLVQPQNYVGEKDIEELEFYILPSAKLHYTFYEDDGETQNYRKDDYSLTNIDISKNEKFININLNKAEGNYNSSIKNYLFKIFDVQNLHSLKVNGNIIKEFSFLEITSNNYGYMYDSSERILKIFIEKQNDINIVGKFK